MVLLFTNQNLIKVKQGDRYKRTVPHYTHYNSSRI